MVSHSLHTFGPIFEIGTKLRMLVWICSYFTLTLHIILQTHITCHAMHLVPNVTQTGLEAMRPDNRSHRIALDPIDSTRSRNVTGLHVPFVSSTWRAPYPDTHQAVVQPYQPQSNGNSHNESSVTRRARTKRYSRTGTNSARPNQPQGLGSFSSWWPAGTVQGENAHFDESAFVINNSEMYASPVEIRLLDTKRPRQDVHAQPRAQPFHGLFGGEDSKSRGWRSLSSEKEKEISRFVVSLLSRYTVSVDPLQVYSIIYQWESYQHQKQLAAHRQWTLKVRQQKRRQRKLKEYNRHLRYFASVLTEQHLSQLRKARNFSEFKQIMFDQPASHSTDREPGGLPPSSLIGPPIHYPVPGQNIVAASSSALQFPGGSGGGIVVNSLRSARKGNTRESRAISDIPEPLESINDKSNPGEHSADRAKDSSNSDQKRLLMDNQDEDEEPSYSEAELRSAFESYQEFRQTACQPRTHILCVRSLLDLHQEHTAVVIPRGFHVRRCGAQIQPMCGYHSAPVSTEVDGEDSDVDMLSSAAAAAVGVEPADLFGSYPPTRTLVSEADHVEFVMDRGRTGTCECETAEEECLPTNVTLRTQAVAISRILPLQNLKHSTELIVVTDHVSCGCQPRCKNRLCVPPLKLVIHTFSDCACVCPPNDVRCRHLLDGVEQFSMNEIPLPLNGSYILPPCRHGPMDDEHLYHRRCPRPIRRQIARK